MTKAPGSTNLALALCYAAMMVLAISVNLPPVYLTTFGDTLGGLTMEQLGRIPALIFIGLVAGTLLTGPLADRFGPKPFLLLGLAICGVGLGLTASVWSYASVLVAVAVMGFGTGVLDMVLSPIVSALKPERRGSAMNWLHSFYCLGAVFTVLIGSISLRYQISFRVVSLAMISLPLAVFLGFLAIRVPPLVTGPETLPVRKLWRHRYFQVALLAMFLAGGTELGLTQLLPAYSELGLGFPKWIGSMALVGFSLMMTLGRFSAGLLGHKMDPIRMMILGCVLTAILYFVGASAGWATLALGACVLGGLTCSVLWPSILAAAADRFHQGGATMFAWLAAIGNMGGVIMPWLIGYIADHSSLRWGISSVIACPLLLIVLLVWMNCQKHIEMPHPPTTLTGVQVAD